MYVISGKEKPQAVTGAQIFNTWEKNWGDVISIRTDKEMYCCTADLFFWMRPRQRNIAKCLLRFMRQIRQQKTSTNRGH